MSSVLVFHRPGDNHVVHVVKEDIVEWFESDGEPKGTKITEINGGWRVVAESVDEVTKIYNEG